MDAIVVDESGYGDTGAVAESIAEGLGAATVLSVHEDPEAPLEPGELERARAWGVELAGLVRLPTKAGLHLNGSSGT